MVGCEPPLHLAMVVCEPHSTLQWSAVNPHYPTLNIGTSLYMVHRRIPAKQTKPPRTISQLHTRNSTDKHKSAYPPGHQPNLTHFTVCSSHPVTLKSNRICTWLRHLQCRQWQETSPQRNFVDLTGIKRDTDVATHLSQSIDRFMVTCQVSELLRHQPPHQIGQFGFRLSDRLISFNLFHPCTGQQSMVDRRQVTWCRPPENQHTVKQQQRVIEGKVSIVVSVRGGLTLATHWVAVKGHHK